MQIGGIRATTAARGSFVGADVKKEVKRRWAWMIATVAVCLLLILGASSSAGAANRSQVDRVWKHRVGNGMASLIADDIVVGGRVRAQLYDRMAADLDEKGAAFLNGGETSQSLKLSDLFKFEDGKVTPVLKAAEPPVRASVLRLNGDYALQISEVVKKVLSPYFSGGPIWYQDVSFYHFSLFHASHHIETVPATESEVEAEAAAVKEVASRCCPLEIVLDRVLLTPTGVLLGCWQVLNGTEPATIRKELRNALPNAPDKQLYDPVILHTSIARILGPPKFSAHSNSDVDSLLFMKSLVSQINQELFNFRAKVNELWFVEELDILALALKGRLVVRDFRMRCSSSH